jgi:hypothetical protein
MKHDPVASVRWFRAEQSLAWALQAYYAACRAVEPPPGQPFIDRDGEAWVSKGDFLHAFHSALTVPLSGSASEQLGWPDKADHAGKVAFLECLKIWELPLPENQGNNAIAGEIA